MVSVSPVSSMSMSSRWTPASSHRITRSSPSANMSVVGTQAVAWVLRWYSCAPPSAYSLMRAISLIVSTNPRNGFFLRSLPILPPSDLLGIYLTSAGSAGLCLQSFKILGYGRPHPAHRAPGNEDRLSLHLARFVGISESQLAHLSEDHQLPTFSARSTKYEVLSDPS